MGSHGDLNVFTVIQIAHSLAAAPVMTDYHRLPPLITSNDSERVTCCEGQDGKVPSEIIVMKF